MKREPGGGINSNIVDDSWVYTSPPPPHHRGLRGPCQPACPVDRSGPRLDGRQRCMGRGRCRRHLRC
eukprot:242467-Pyramimonas_sp.AAC.1